MSTFVQDIAAADWSPAYAAEGANEKFDMLSKIYNEVYTQEIFRLSRGSQAAERTRNRGYLNGYNGHVTEKTHFLNNL